MKIQMLAVSVIGSLLISSTWADENEALHERRLQLFFNKLALLMS
jgi:hypothetical protein